MHIGFTAWTEIGPFRKAYARIVDLASKLQADGFNIESFGLKGGGLGIPYGDTKEPQIGPVEYARMVEEIFTGILMAK